MDKLVDPSSVSIFGPCGENGMTNPHLFTTPDPSEALKKFNKLFTSGFTKLESWLAKVSSHESQFDSSTFHHSRILVEPH